VPGEQEERGGGEQGGGQRASRRSAAADRHASRRRLWGIAVAGANKERRRKGMTCGGHMSVSGERGQGRMGTPASGPNMVLDVHNSVFPTAGEL